MDSSSVSRECYMIRIRFHRNYLLTVIQTSTFLPTNEKSNMLLMRRREVLQAYVVKRNFAILPQLATLVVSNLEDIHSGIPQ